MVAPAVRPRAARVSRSARASTPSRASPPTAARSSRRSSTPGSNSCGSLPTDPGRCSRCSPATSRTCEPSVSPVGDRIVWSSTRSGSRNLWIAAADGSAARPLTSGDALDTLPPFSPDGRSRSPSSPIARDGAASGSSRCRGGAPREICRLTEVVGTPSWSPDGQEILVCAPARLRTWACSASPSRTAAPCSIADADRRQRARLESARAAHRLPHSGARHVRNWHQEQPARVRGSRRAPPARGAARRVPGFGNGVADLVAGRPPAAGAGPRRRALRRDLRDGSDRESAPYRSIFELPLGSDDAGRRLVGRRRSRSSSASSSLESDVVLLSAD